MKIIIIGGGPAGLECASVLENSEHEVLIIEKNPFPINKACAGGISLDLNNGIVINKQKVFFENKSIKINYKLSLMSRTELSTLQLQKLNKTKKIIDEVVSINEYQVETRHSSFSYDILIGADGNQSVVRKFLKLENSFAFAYYQELPRRTKKDTAEWHIHPKYGYIWKFPHKKHDNVGIYYNPKYLTTVQAIEKLKQFSKSNNKVQGGIIQYKYQGYKFKNIFLIGEAAGLTSKLTGEGISQAIISGTEVAKKILDPNYKQKELNKIIRMKKIQNIPYLLLRYYPNLGMKTLNFIEKKKIKL